jgi:hypothetical protein
MPAYLNFETQDEFNEYFDLLSESMRTNEFEAFAQKYNRRIKRMEMIMGPVDLGSYLQDLTMYKEEILEFSKIFKNNFQTYYLNVWQIEKEKLKKKADILNNELPKYDFIGAWEKLTGIDFKTDLYEIVLFSANKNGPSANSLGYGRNTFYYGLDTNLLLQFISHEVGTHILIDLISEAIRMNRFEFQDIYAAFENIAEFYNVKFVFAGSPIFGYDVENYYQIFDDVYNSNLEISPIDLMIRGIEIFHKSSKQGSSSINSE